MVQQSRKQHVLVGVGAVLCGVALGFIVVYWDSVQERELVAQAATTACPDGDYSCPVGQTSKSGKPCMLDFKCVATTPGGMCPGTCKGPGPGEVYCKSIGSCDGKALEGKPKEAPKEDGKGMPKLPELPKGGGGGQPPPPQPQQEDCLENPSSTECQIARRQSGVSGFLNNWLGTNDATSPSTGNQSLFSSALNRLSSFLTGSTEDASNDTETSEPTSSGSDVVSGVDGSSQTTLSSSGSSNALDTSQEQGVSSSFTGQVTGFGSNAAGQHVDASTGPILSAIRNVVGRIQGILSSLF